MFVEDYSLSLPQSETEVVEGDVEFDQAVQITLFAGYRPLSFFRVEGELGYRNHSAGDAVARRVQNGVVTETVDLKEQLEEGERLAFKAFTTMANVYVDVPLAQTLYVDPYIGVGGGWLFQIDGAEHDGFAWQAMAGISYPLNNGRSMFSLGYRYFEAPNLFDQTGYDFDAVSHVVEVSYREFF